MLVVKALGWTRWGGCQNGTSPSSPKLCSKLQLPNFQANTILLTSWPPRRPVWVCWPLVHSLGLDTSPPPLPPQGSYSMNSVVRASGKAGLRKTQREIPNPTASYSAPLSLAGRRNGLSVFSPFPRALSSQVMPPGFCTNLFIHVPEPADVWLAWPSLLGVARSSPSSEISCIPAPTSEPSISRSPKHFPYSPAGTTLSPMPSRATRGFLGPITGTPSD